MELENQFRIKDKETELVIAKIKDSYIFATHTLWSLEVATITLSPDQVKELITFLEEKQ